MSLVEKQDYKITTTSEYTTALFSADTPEEQQLLFNTIRDKYKVEPALGEIMLVRGKPYFTAPGCSRIAETKQNKDVKFEYIDPTTFNVLLVRKNPERYIIVSCYLTKLDGGVVQGNRLFDLEDEKHWQWGVCCWVDNPYKKGKKLPAKLLGPNESHEKVCSVCHKILVGYDGWKLKDYMGFTETKAFMRAVGKAYNIELFEDLPEDLKKEAKDLVKILKTDVKVEPKASESDLSDEGYDELVNAPPVKPNAVKEEKEVKTEIIRPTPTPPPTTESHSIDIGGFLYKSEKPANGQITFEEWFASLKDCEFKGKPAKQIILGAPGLIAEKYAKDGAEPKTFKISNTITKKFTIVPIWKVNCPADWKDNPYMEIPCELMIAEKDKWEKILP